jgi:hypothetical protein
LQQAGFTVIVASTASLSDAEAQKLRRACDELILRENRGFDFGSWIDCYANHPPEADEFLLLCNDSVYGPIGSLPRALEALTKAPADFYGFVASNEIARHLQTWFVLMRPAAYQSQAFRAMMDGSPHGLSKEVLVRDFEIGITSRLEAEGLRMHALYDPNRDGLISRFYPFNPAHFLWEGLIRKLGVPFVKVDLLRDNPRLIATVRRWPDVIGASNPAAVAGIRADLRARHATDRFVDLANARPGENAGPPPPDKIYLPWRQSFVMRDYALVASGRRVAAALNVIAFAFVYAAALLARTLRR